MNKSRTDVPSDTSAQLMFQNRHRCCICHKPRKHVQIHHIDRNPSNHALQNLAALCVDCHSIVTGNQGFGKSYSTREVVLNKKDWEQKCQAWRDESGNEQEHSEEDEDEIIDDYYADSILRGSEHEVHTYQLEEGNEIVFGISSDEPISFMIMKKRHYEHWAESGEEKSYESYEDVYDLDNSFIVPKDGLYSIVVCNLSAEDVRVQTDISIWP